MKKTLRLILLAAATMFFAACGGPPADTSENNANTNTTKPIAPTADALMALDKQSNEAYVKGNSKFLEGMLNDKFVILGGGQRMDRPPPSR
jgi:PBP1b-binding outer membrane lipoprotein LpoB